MGIGGKDRKVPQSARAGACNHRVKDNYLAMSLWRGNGTVLERVRGTCVKVAKGGGVSTLTAARTGFEA